MAWRAVIEEGSLNHWWTLPATDQGEGCQLISPPPTFIELDRLIEVAARKQSMDSGLLPPTLTCSRGCEGPYSPKKDAWARQWIRSTELLPSGSPAQAGIGSHWEGCPGFRQLMPAHPSMSQSSKLKAQNNGGGELEEEEEGGPGSRRWLKRCGPVREQPGGGCLLLLHSSLLSCALLAGALALVLVLPIPRGLLEHKPTVPGPQ